MIFAHKRLIKRFEKELSGKTVIKGYHCLFPFYGKDCSGVTERERARERMSCEEYHQKQAEFGAMARKAVAEGKTVAMLDSGDPLIYGPASWTLKEFRDIPGGGNTRSELFQCSQCRPGPGDHQQGEVPFGYSCFRLVRG